MKVYVKFTWLSRKRLIDVLQSNQLKCSITLWKIHRSTSYVRHRIKFRAKNWMEVAPCVNLPTCCCSSVTDLEMPGSTLTCAMLSVKTNCFIDKSMKLMK